MRLAGLHEAAAVLEPDFELLQGLGADVRLDFEEVAASPHPAAWGSEARRVEQAGQAARRGVRRRVPPVLEVPKERGYTVSDIKADGQPIMWGGQVAQRVRIRIDALVKRGSHKPEAQPCVG
jgi:hypothetical protein